MGDGGGKTEAATATQRRREATDDSQAGSAVRLERADARATTADSGGLMCEQWRGCSFGP